MVIYLRFVVAQDEYVKVYRDNFFMAEAERIRCTMGILDSGMKRVVDASDLIRFNAVTWVLSRRDS